MSTVDFVRAYRLRFVLIAAIFLGLLAYIRFAPQAQIKWNPIDYDNFRGYGAAFRDGVTGGYLYPLPTVMWLFTPLSFAPNWFVFVWVAAPFAVCLILFGPKGGILWLAVPLLMHAGLGQVDGWFLLPLYWLASDHKVLAGPSAAFITLKPQLAIFIVPYMIYRWLGERNRRALISFVLVVALLYLPSFIIEPAWPLKMLEIATWRGTQPLLVTRGASLWAWWWRSGWTRLLLPFAVASVIVLFLKVQRRSRPKAVFLAGLLVTPMLFPLSFTTAIAMIPNAIFPLIIFTVSSWVALVIDVWLGGWGGAYAIIPISVLWSLTRYD